MFPCYLRHCGKGGRCSTWAERPVLTILGVEVAPVSHSTGYSDTDTQSMHDGHRLCYYRWPAPAGGRRPAASSSTTVPPVLRGRGDQMKKMGFLNIQASLKRRKEIKLGTDRLMWEFVFLDCYAYLKERAYRKEQKRIQDEPLVTVDFKVKLNHERFQEYIR